MIAKNEMFEPSASTNNLSKWRLWIDRCGGFELIQGSRWVVGGMRPGAGTEGSLADIQVHADWRRVEGEIVRQAEQYLWVENTTDGRSESNLVVSGAVVPVRGSAAMLLSQPSPLSKTAMLTLRPPHRFGNHIDSVILVDQTVLIGPGPSNHIRCGSHDEDAVLVLRNGVWQAKLKPSPENDRRRKRTKSTTDLIELVPGRRTSVGQIDMTLEKV